MFAFGLVVKLVPSAQSSYWILESFRISWIAEKLAEGIKFAGNRCFEKNLPSEFKNFIFRSSLLLTLLLMKLGC